MIIQFKSKESLNDLFIYLFVGGEKINCQQSGGVTLASGRFPHFLAFYVLAGYFHH